MHSKAFRRNLLSSFVVLLVGASSVTAEQFDPLHHSGPASPYFVAPPLAGVPSTVPDGCVVDQAAWFLRHGSRYPEPGSFTGWENLFAKFQNASYTARGPLSFIPFWTLPIDDEPHQPLFLSSTGAGEAFALGVKLRKRYGFTKGGENITVWTAWQQRVVDTATYFTRGYLSAGNYLTTPSLNRGTLIVLPDSTTNTTFADSLTPSSSCPAYGIFSGNGSSTSDSFRSTFRQGIADRLNRFLDGLVLDTTDIGVMQDLCGFGFEVSGDHRFCDIFTENEWLDYEYAHDLNYYYGSGPGNPLSATVGFPWLKAVTDLFEVGPGNTVKNGTLVPPPLIMGFTHDNNIPPLISALGLWNSSQASPLPITHRPPLPAREFRSSHLVSFLGNVAIERMSCVIGGPTSEQAMTQGVFHQANVLGGTVVNVNTTGTREKEEEVFIRVLANEAVIPIPRCRSGPGSSCPLDEFVGYVNGERKGVAGGFVERCGLEGVVDVEVGDEVRFLTVEGDREEMLVGLN
ncbi:phosphoglycerate mutase-like protein [Dendrothele bispora CBS 962.96]|uniref:Phosphoglycerate mutase-like protein n=1 Tax=Dendrothele bispora (strain CBS 962.96) TaxID=1314807 RepID=A0A4S8LJQ8_DENBC|nr:phosphoglycerate mutase-like protein [Dendrothele bispora CBS 962.96]THU92277.1 phosphoglycerate mutase-like protein [Dendrothele bispora CBS 962.96]